MKREVRLPTKGYDILRQQVQARRGSPTNRMLPEERSSADLVDSAAAENGAAAPIDDLSARRGAGDAPARGSAAGEANVSTREAAADPTAPEASDPDTDPDTGPDRRAARRAPTARHARRAAPSSLRPDARRVTLKINVTAPAIGVFPFYDRVIETMPPRKAVPLLLAKAFDELEAAAIRGDPVRLEEYEMQRNGARISTSRTMDVATLEKLRASVDPHSLMRLSSLGAALATSALSLYLRRHG